ncbi:MAG: VTT domain-containing protein [Rhodospirillales bacterium]
MTPKLIIRGLVLIGLLVALGFLLKSSGLGEIIDKDWIDVHVHNNGFEGRLLFVGVAALLAAAGFPRQIISFLAGYAFDLNLGFVLALIACGIGCTIAFFFARIIGRDWVKSKFPRRLDKADQFFSANTFTTTLLIRFMPAGSNFVTNLVAGVSGAKALSFIAGSTLGYIPQTVIFALLGSGINLDPGFRITLSVVLFISSIALGIFLYRKYKRSAVLNGDID